MNKQMTRAEIALVQQSFARLASTVFDGDVAAFDVAGLSQATKKSRQRQRVVLAGSNVDPADHRHRRCCARAASGKAAEQAIDLMNSRRLIRSPRRRGRATLAE